MFNRKRTGFVVAAALVGAPLLVSCGTQPAGGAASTVAVVPRCTILCNTFVADTSPNSRVGVDGSVLVFERTNPNVDHGFTALRGLGGPRGNPPIGFTPDVYGISEAWSRNPFAPEVHRAQAIPASRTVGGGTDMKGSAWVVQAQAASGAWSRVFSTGTANRGDEEDTPAAAGATVPQLMPVGIATPQVFACAGGRSDDGAQRTTLLFESAMPNPSRNIQGGLDFIQDLLNGDDRFVPNAPGPLRGPSAPPTPRVSGPGGPINVGAVKCAMAQQDDDVNTRELHMLGIAGGRLYHSLANNFGSVTRESGSTFNRFRSVSRWTDLSQVLGANFGNVVSASIVASRPSAVSVFFVAESGGVYRLWHTVRFTATGAWRPAADVLALSGDAPTGSVYPWQVAAGTCPEPGATSWTVQNTEMLVTLWGGPAVREIMVIRVLNSAQNWRAGVTGIYSPWRSLGELFRGVDPVRNPSINSIFVTTRPFRDDAVP